MSVLQPARKHHSMSTRTASTRLVEAPISPGPYLTVPNAITVARTAVAVTLGFLAVTQQDASLLAAAYASYWVGDILDGWTARRLDQETRAGAVLDIVCDRACTAVACCALVTVLPEAAPVVTAFFLSFMVLDTMLSFAFLLWPVRSPNYFYVIDRAIWLSNWSPAAKAVNTSGVVIALVLQLYALALALTLIVAVVKVWSLGRLGPLLVRTPRT